MSSRSREWFRHVYQPLTYNKSLLATDSGTLDNVLAVRNSNYTIYVQAIEFACAAGGAQTLTFQDDAGTPVVIAKTKATAVQGDSYLFDFGPEGIPLTAGKNLDIVISGAALAGGIHVEGYQKLTSATAIGSV